MNEPFDPPAAVTLDDAPPVGAPRWVKVSAVIGVVIVLPATVLALAGGHGPGRHTSGVDPSIPGPVEIISHT